MIHVDRSHFAKPAILGSSKAEGASPGGVED